ncbi:hypothetical protein SAMN05421858_0794 [Haladaptatus litoreus]|uniref:Uncharacterized protein n=1 Tax=Haladaptatus litoreus TaxID=553468 RepID=A0A1N6WMR7_9EURY|nr:hypothetical protein [Haladaptatus litoreus]SIQ91371.1 hypothetical protein SAMN05421858_0794 [Haladaptatus litoreus]
MPPWSRERAQAEPLPALIAVFAVCVGLVTYTGVLGDAMPEPNRNPAPATLSEVEQVISSNGVVAPTRIADALRTKPAGYRLNITLSTGSGNENHTQLWHAGPPVPRTADSVGSAESAEIAETVVSVRISPGNIRPARLRVEVW